MHEAAPASVSCLASRVGCCVLRVAAHRALNEKQDIRRTACVALTVMSGRGPLTPQPSCRDVKPIQL
eukprot:2993155-Prymnesium_polylepis.1